MSNKRNLNIGKEWAFYPVSVVMFSSHIDVSGFRLQFHSFFELLIDLQSGREVMKTEVAMYLSNMW